MPLSLIYFGFHWLEFFVGSWLGLFRRRFRGGLVLIDRYYYDFLVDQRRYRLNVPDWLVRFGLCLIRQPDLVFLLDAPPEVLLTRKQELTFDETSRQREAYLRVAQSLPNAIVVDAMQPPAQVASDMAKAILEHLSLRAGA